MNARRQPRPSAAKKTGQALSGRVQAVTARYSAVIRVLVRLGKADLITGHVLEAEITRTLERLAAGLFFSDDIEGRSILHVADNPQPLFMWCRRYPQRVRELVAEVNGP
jgi:hypothetical protein